MVSGTGSTDNASFNISGNSLRINASPNFEVKNSYSIRLRSTDAGGLSVQNNADPGETLVFAKLYGPSWLSVSPTGALSGTPSGSDLGVNFFTVTVNDGLGAIMATLNITVDPPGPTFTSFTSTNFSPAEQADPLVSGPDADPDKDGVSNLLEYALAMDPKLPAVANLPQTLTVPVSTDTFVGLTYTRLKGATDLVFTAEFSNSPGSGFTTSASVETSLTDNGNGTETVTLRDTTPITPATPRFVRLRIEQN